MKTRWKLLIGAAFLAGLVLVLPASRLALFGWLAGEPCYRGRPVSYWRYELTDWRIEHSSRPKSDEERLQQKEEERQGKTFTYVQSYPGRWALEHRETKTQKWYHKWQHGETKLQRFCDKWLGIFTKPAWRNPNYREPFCRLDILEGDPAAVPVLTALLKDDDFRIRRLAAAALGRIGREGKAAFPALLETTNRDEDAFLRGIARVALLDIDKVAAERAGISKYFMFWSPQPKLRATIQGHFYPSYTAFTADAKMLALRGEDRTIQLWDVATGNQLTFLQGCTPVVWPLAFSPDGKLVASGDKDNKIKVWELETGKALASLQGHTDRISSLAFNPDSKTLVSGSYDNTVKLWDVASGKNISTPHKYNEFLSWPECVAFSPDGKTLASGSHDWTVKLWDVATGQEQATLEQDLYNDDAWVDSVAFSPDGRVLAWVTNDTIFLWDLADNKNFATIRGDSEHVGSVVFTPDGKMLAVGGDDHEVRLWEFPKGGEF
jgi:hypothetical protein